MKGVILDKVEYDELIKKLDLLERENKLSIVISGMGRNWQYLGYNEGKYGISINSGHNIPPELVKEIEQIFKEELLILNEKVKQFTLLKGEIEVLQKLNNDDSRKEENRS
jgi:hypothetical protein